MKYKKKKNKAIEATKRQEKDALNWKFDENKEREKLETDDNNNNKK